MPGRSAFPADASKPRDEGPLEAALARNRRGDRPVARARARSSAISIRTWCSPVSGSRRSSHSSSPDSRCSSIAREVDSDVRSAAAAHPRPGESRVARAHARHDRGAGVRHSLRGAQHLGRDRRHADGAVSAAEATSRRSDRRLHVLHRSSARDHGAAARSAARLSVGLRADFRDDRAVHDRRGVRSRRCDRARRLAGAARRAGRSVVSGRVSFADGERAGRIRLR